MVEIVGGITLDSPIETEPLDVLLDCIDIFGILLDGIGVVETQIALATVFLCQTEIDADTFGVAYMEVAVRLGRESCLNARSAFGNRLLDYLFEKIERFLLDFICFGSHIHILFIVFRFVVNGRADACRDTDELLAIHILAVVLEYHLGIDLDALVYE